MPRRRIGQEVLFNKPTPVNSLDEMASLIDWSVIAALLDVIHSSSRGEPSWPPLAMFKGLLLSFWYDLSDVKLAESLDDRHSFRRFCGFSSSEKTPERTAFVRFRKALVSHGLESSLFSLITDQLRSQAIVVKTGTIVDATIIRSHSVSDDEGEWVKHRGKSPVHGYKAHVGADVDTALVEEVGVTTANINDGKAGFTALPDKPMDVFADSAYRGQTFDRAVRAKGGTPRVVRTGFYSTSDPVAEAKARERFNANNRAIYAVRGRIEKIFGTWKRSYGLSRMRWRGIIKAGLQIYLTAIVYNLKRTNNLLKAT